MRDARIAGWCSVAVWTVYGVAAGLVVCVAGPMVALGDQDGPGLGIGLEGISGLLLRGLLVVAVVQVMISIVGGWLGLRAARGERISLGVSGAMHAVYAALFGAGVAYGAGPAIALAVVSGGVAFACLRAAVRAYLDERRR